MTRIGQALQNKRAYDKVYAHENFRGKTIQFNRKNELDMELFEWMRTQPEGGAKYIKRLILEDMERNKKDV